MRKRVRKLCLGYFFEPSNWLNSLNSLKIIIVHVNLFPFFLVYLFFVFHSFVLFFFLFLVYKLSFFSLPFFIFIFCFHWRQNMCRWCSLTAVKRHGWKIISKQITTPCALYRSTGSYKINPCSMSMVWRVFREITDVEEKRQIFGTIVCN